MPGLLQMHYADGLVRLRAASVVLEHAAFCSSSLYRWSLFIRQHQQMDLQMLAHRMPWIVQNMSAFPFENAQDFECTIEWAKYRENALH